MALRPAKATPHGTALTALHLSTGELGALAEELAARHLRRLGFRLIGRNLEAPEAELDIVGLDGDALVVIEVKAGWWPVPESSGEAAAQRAIAGLRGHQRPSVRVSDQAVRRRRRAAERLLKAYHPLGPHGTAMPRQARVDVVEVITGRGRRALLLHHRDFSPTHLRRESP